MKTLFTLITLSFFTLNSTSQNIFQNQKLVASDRANYENLGKACSMQGKWMVQGVEDEIGYDPSGNIVNDRGAVYVFLKDSNDNWSETQKLLASGPLHSNNFGQNVLIEGDFLFISAPESNLDSAYMNSVGRAGAMYIFKLDSTNQWIEHQVVTGYDRHAWDYFGHSFDADSSCLVVGTPFQDWDSTGIVNHGGGAYVFELNTAGKWVLTQKILSNDISHVDYFGESVAVNNGEIVVGAKQESHNETGGSFVYYAGSAYVFKKNVAGTWMQTQKIVPPDREREDWFGSNMEMEDGKLLIAAPREDNDTNGLNFMTSSGSIYYYLKDTSNNWVFEQKITGNPRKVNQYLGGNMDFQGNKLICGYQNDDLDENNLNFLSAAGSALIFELDTNGKWNFLKKKTATQRHVFSRFGASVAVYNDYFVVGSSQDNTDENDLNPLASTGSAYIFGKFLPLKINYTQSFCDSIVSPVSSKVWFISGVYTDTVIIDSTYGCYEYHILNANKYIFDRSVSVSGITLTSNESAPLYQ
jgi:hypothetical protein